MNLPCPTIVLRALVGAALFGCSSAGSATPGVPTGRIFEAEFQLPTPRKESPRSAEGSAEMQKACLFIPDEVETVRGVILNPFYDKMAEKEYWQTLCAHWDFAVMGTNYFGVKGDEFGEVTLGLLNAFAEVSEHPELAKAPLALVGMSAGGGMSTRIAEAIPDRVIAVAPVCLEVGPRDERSRKIPMLTVFGERDGSQLEKLTAKLPTEREGDAQWAITIQWGKRHDWHRASNVIIPFFDAVIEDRVAPHLGGWKHWGESPARIAPASDFGEGAVTACWLPDADSAAAWQALTTKNQGIRIKAPLGIGGGHEFMIHPAGKPIEVEAALRDKSITDLKLFDGAKEIGTFGEGGLRSVTPPLERGPHVLILRGVDSEGNEEISEPHVILVR